MEKENKVIQNQIHKSLNQKVIFKNKSITYYS